MGNQGTFNPNSIIFFWHKTQCLVQKTRYTAVGEKKKKNENKKSKINQEDGILTTVNNIEVLRHKQCKNGTFVVVGKEWHKSRRRNYTA